MAGIGSISNTWDRMFVYCSFKPRKNCIARSSSFLCAIMAKAEQEHLLLQVQAGSGLKFSISSQITRNLVKYSVTERAPCFNVDASCCKSEILRRSPCEYLDFRSLQISSALSIQSTLCLIEAATECTIQDTTILLHRRQAPYVLSVLSGSGALPSTNSSLFLALSAVIMERLHEW